MRFSLDLDHLVLSERTTPDKPLQELPGLRWETGVVGTDRVTDNSIYRKLYVDNQLVDTGPAVQMPKSYTPPRFGQAATNFRGVPLTRFRAPLSKQDQVLPFKGRVDDFRMLNESGAPVRAP
jgi:hypothetical protein